jgi:hypothetical protein
MSPNSDTHAPDASGSEGMKIIDLEFETLRQFREVMAPRLNYDGFFIVTKTPLPRGTPARFRFLLPDGFVLAEGSGVVTWVRHEDEDADNRAGMAVLFDELASQSREIIDELIDFHIATGGDPFDLGARGSEAGDIGTDALAGDSLEVQPPAAVAAPPEGPQPVPGTGEPPGESPEEYLPEWLSEVAQKHDVDLSTDETAPSATPPEVPEPADPSPAAEQDFEVSLFPEEEEPDATPFQGQDDPAAEVTLPHRAAVKPPRDFRLRLILPIVAVLIAASAVVFWIVNRAPAPESSEPIASVEETSATDPPIDGNEGTAGEPLGGPVEEPVGEGVEIDEGDVVAEPPATSQVAEESVPDIGRQDGPATVLLLVSGSRISDETVITVRANGVLSDDVIRVSRLKNPARVWIRIQGIETFYRPNDINVEGPDVERIRVGHHPEETPQSIYVVCDLEDPRVVVREQTVEGDTLRVVVGRP